MESPSNPFKRDQPEFVDTPKHVGLRRRMVKDLEANGIVDKDVLHAMFKVPRHWFMDAGFESQAYENKAMPIGEDQTISQPYTVALQTQLLELKYGDKVLEIGTGSGYQAAILAMLGAKLYTVERIDWLHHHARKNLERLNLAASFSLGDGSNGLPFAAPFSKIIITCGIPEIPQSLIDQLDLGGVLVAPEGPSEQQVMKKLTKTIDGVLEESYGIFSFVPLIGKAGYK